MICIQRGVECLATAAQRGTARRSTLSARKIDVAPLLPATATSAAVAR